MRRMSKMRIYELAKQLGVANKELMELYQGWYKTSTTATRTKDTLTADSFFQDTTAHVDNLIASYIYTQYFLTTKGSKTPYSDKPDASMAANIKVSYECHSDAAIALCKAVDTIAYHMKHNSVVIGKKDKTITVMGTQYAQWLKSGGSPEIILGESLTSTSPTVSAKTLTEKADVFKHAWDKHYRLSRMATINAASNSAANILRVAAKNLLTEDIDPVAAEYYKTRPEQKEGELDSDYQTRLDNEYWNMSPVKGIFKSFGDAPGGFSEELKEIMWSLGAEYDYDSKFRIRTGYFHENKMKGNRQYMSFGAGFKLTAFQLDVAYMLATAQQNPLDQTLRFSLAFDIDGMKNLFR